MNFQREDREGVTPTRELPVERQAGRTEANGRKTTEVQSSSQDPLVQSLGTLKGDDPFSPAGGAQQAAE